MSEEFHPKDIAGFLVKAKRNTYAGLDDDATISNPLLENSTQLEWQDGRWFYRDIYHGMSFFTGMEVVYFNTKPVWAMSYSGGVLPGVELEDARVVYKFLRSALMLVSIELPLRGPAFFKEGNCSYKMSCEGDLSTFDGREEISIAASKKYEFSFAGGLVR